MNPNWAVSKHPVNSGKPDTTSGNPERSPRNTRERAETRHGATLKCTVCETPKDPSEFYKKNREGRLDRTCKSCRIIGQREKVLGVTEGQYRALYHDQAGKCGICQRRIYSKRYKRLAVDHCHTTGRIRGLLCTNCNTGIGLLRDCPVTLQRAIEWVKV